MEKARYHLTIIGQRLKQYGVFYGLIALELTICFTIVFCGINESHSWNEREKMLRMENERGLHSVEVANIRHFLDANREVDQTLASTSGPYLYGQQYTVDGMNPSGGFLQFELILANQLFFKTYLNMESHDPTLVYMTQEMRSVLEKASGPTLLEDVAIGSDYLVIKGKNVNFATLKDGYEAIPNGLGYEEDIDSQKAVFLYIEEDHSFLNNPRWALLKYWDPDGSQARESNGWKS